MWKCHKPAVWLMDSIGQLLCLQYDVSIEVYEIECPDVWPPAIVLSLPQNSTEVI